jgi:hypothetical protein
MRRAEKSLTPRCSVLVLDSTLSVQSSWSCPKLWSALWHCGINALHYDCRRFIWLASIVQDFKGTTTSNFNVTYGLQKGHQSPSLIMPSSTETQSGTELANGPHLLSQDAETDAMLKTAESNHAKPLWLQMSRLNPPKPNPRCTPYVWEYERIRPSLLKAGELIAEEQAERRVLMLVNPSRGQTPPPMIH